MRHALNADQQLVLEVIFNDWIGTAAWPKEVRLVLRFKGRGLDFFRRTVESIPGNLVAVNQGMASERRYRLTMEGLWHCRSGAPIIRAHLDLLKLAVARFREDPKKWAFVTDKDLAGVLDPNESTRIAAYGTAILDESGSWAQGSGRDDKGGWNIRAGLRIVKFARVKTFEDYLLAGRPSSPLKEIGDNHLEFMRLIFLHWREHMTWPVLGDFVVQYLEKGDAWRLLHEISTDKYWFGFEASDSSDPTKSQRIRLRLKGIEATGVAREELDLAARIVGALCERFQKAQGDRISVSSTEIASDLEIPLETIRAVGTLLEWTGDFGVHFDPPAETGEWTATPAMEILPFEGVQTYEDLDRIKKEVEEGYIREASRRKENGGLRPFLNDQPGPGLPVPKVSTVTLPPGSNEPRWDVFICHASEDKETIVEDLVKALQDRELRVWYDRLSLRIGDSLRRKIDEGLRQSRFGVVVLSPAFFEKQWPQRELDGLVQREIGERQVVILPVWHNVSRADVAAQSPTLADKVAGTTARGIPLLADEIVSAVKQAGLMGPAR